MAMTPNELNIFFEVDGIFLGEATTGAQDGCRYVVLVGRGNAGTPLPNICIDLNDVTKLSEALVAITAQAIAQGWVPREG